MSSFNALHIGLSGLVAQQLREDTIGHNIANVNTTGYTRRSVLLSAVPAADLTVVPPQSGRGVSVTGVQRSTSQLLNQQVQRESSGNSYWQSVSTGMQNLEAVFQEPTSGGLSTQLSEFWSAWGDLASDPTSSSARLSVQTAGNSLTADIRQLYSQTQTFVTNLDKDTKTQVASFNQLASEIASLNQQISQAPANNPALDLQDQRDTALEELSKLAHMSSAENKDGTMTVSVGGHVLVSGTHAVSLEVKADGNGHGLLVWSDNQSTATISEGELGANQRLQDWALNEVIPNLNQLATNLMKSVNDLHSTGYGLDGATGRNFFTGTGASNIQLDPGTTANPGVATNTDAIAAGTATVQSGTTTQQPGDGSIAQKIADLQTSEVSALNDSISGFYASIVTRIGNDTKEAGDMADNQSTLLESLQGQRDDLSGVSLDEEAVQLLAAQRAYQAASRVITTADEMLDRLINSTGLVGR